MLGALLFAGSLCRGHYAVWPGLIGGVVCALVGLAATRPLLARVRAPARRSRRPAALPLFAEARRAAAGGAVGRWRRRSARSRSLLLLWLLIAGRRRGEQKYAGLRILR